jgi:hypothetical protein
MPSAFLPTSARLFDRIDHLTPADVTAEKNDTRDLEDARFSRPIGSAARSAPCGDHDLGEPSRARRLWA